GPGPCLANTRALRPELAAPPGLQRRPPQRPVPAARHHPRPFLRMGPAAADPGGDPTRFLAARGGDRAVRHRRHRRLAAGRSPGLDLYRRRRRPARGDGPHALGRLRGRARRRRAAPAHRRGPLRRPRGPVVGRDRPLLPGPRARRLVAGAGSGHDACHLHLVGQAGPVPLLPGPAAPVAPAEPDRGHRADPALNGLAAVLIGGPPATGKSTLAAANLRTGRPVVLVAPFSTERVDPSALATTTRLLSVRPTPTSRHCGYLHP